MDELLKDFEKYNNMLKKYNYCHDGIIKNMLFKKEREVDPNDGSIIYPLSETQDSNEEIKCGIEVEMILNSYEGAKNDQIVVLEFMETVSFNCSQKDRFDYSDVYEVRLLKNSDPTLNFVIFATSNKVEFLEICCLKFNVRPK